MILPQSLKKQPPESQELLAKVRISLHFHSVDIPFAASWEAMLHEFG